jgi:hypothetical protein
MFQKEKSRIFKLILKKLFKARGQKIELYQKTKAGAKGGKAMGCKFTGKQDQAHPSTCLILLAVAWTCKHL